MRYVSKRFQIVQENMFDDKLFPVGSYKCYIWSLLEIPCSTVEERGVAAESLCDIIITVNVT